MNRSKLNIVLMVVFSVLMTASCNRKRENPTWTYMPDMAYSPAIKASEEGSMKNPVKGTVHRNQELYPFAADPEMAGRELKNPIPRTRSNLLEGKELFTVYCSVCHGHKGFGNGSVVPPMTRPPSLHSTKVRSEWADGRIFHVITVGQGVMGSYAHALYPEERWKVIHYIRALQRSQNPTDADLERAKNWK